VQLPSDLEVLRLRDFRLVFSAAVVSLIGDGAVSVALAFAVLDLTGSPTWASCSRHGRSRWSLRCSSAASWLTGLAAGP
jgi:hypothetical protein